MALSINIFFINGTEHVFNDVVSYDHDNHAIKFTTHNEDGSTSEFDFGVNSIAGFQTIYTQDEPVSEPDSDSEVAPASEVASDSDVASEPSSEEVDSMADAVSQVSQAVASVDNALSGVVDVATGINEKVQSNSAITSESSNDDEVQSEAQPNAQLNAQPSVFY